MAKKPTEQELEDAKNTEAQVAQAVEAHRAEQSTNSAPEVEPVSDSETVEVLKDFYAGTMKPGVSVRFETRGGVTIPVVRKLS